MKAWIRVKYTGEEPINLGVYGTVVPGEMFSISRPDWMYMDASTDGIPDYLEKLGESNENEGRVQPTPPVDRQAKLDWANAHEGVEIGAAVLDQLAGATDSEFLDALNALVQAVLNPETVLPEPQEMTVSELQAELEAGEVEFPSKARKPELIELVLALREKADEEETGEATEGGDAPAVVFNDDSTVNREATLAAVVDSGTEITDENREELAEIESDDDWLDAVNVLIAEAGTEGGEDTEDAE